MGQEWKEEETDRHKRATAIGPWHGGVLMGIDRHRWHTDDRDMKAELNVSSLLFSEKCARDSFAWKRLLN